MFFSSYEDQKRKKNQQDKKQFFMNIQINNQNDAFVICRRLMCFIGKIW
jgi:hypothetical protein